MVFEARDLVQLNKPQNTGAERLLGVRTNGLIDDLMTACLKLLGKGPHRLKESDDFLNMLSRVLSLLIHLSHQVNRVVLRVCKPAMRGIQLIS